MQVVIIGSTWHAAYGSSISRSAYYIKYNIIGDMPYKNSDTRYTASELTPVNKYISLYTQTNSTVALDNIKKHTEVVGYTFSGWYTDSTLTNSYTGTSKTTSNVNLYGKYTAKDIDLAITTVAYEDNSIKLPNCKYNLYKLVCKNSSHNHEEDIINTNEENIPCYELVETFTTDENGEILLKNLNYESQYRLVETKTVDDRLLTEGQWNIRFASEDENCTLETDGVLVSISSINNAPEVKVDKNGKAIITNKKGYELPLTGGNGTSISTTLGSIITLTGLIVLKRKIKATTKPKLIINKIISRERNK